MMKQTKKYLIAIIFAFFSLSMQAQSDRFMCDDSCDPDATSAVKYKVVSPVGFSTVEPIEMASRLTTLNGKTIAIVGRNPEGKLVLTSPCGACRQVMAEQQIRQREKMRILCYSSDDKILIFEDVESLLPFIFTM